MTNNTVMEYTTHWNHWNEATGTDFEKTSVSIWVNRDVLRHMWARGWEWKRC